MTEHATRPVNLLHERSGGASLIAALEGLTSAAGIRAALDPVAGIDWAMIGGEIVRAVEKSLATGVREALIVLWTQRYRGKPDGEDTGGVALVPLLRHRADVTFDVPVEVSVGDFPAASFTIGAKLVLDVQSAVLAIESGRLSEVRRARGSLHGSLSCERVEIADFNVTNVDLAAYLGIESAPGA